MSNPAKRIASWVAKVTVAKLTMDTPTPNNVFKADQRQNFKRTSTDQVSMEQRVRQTYGIMGVSCVEYNAYQCFARAIWKLQRRGITGESMVVEANRILAHNIGQGLREEVLRKILADVFHVGLPL